MLQKLRIECFHIGNPDTHFVFLDNTWFIWFQACKPYSHPARRERRTTTQGKKAHFLAHRLRHRLLREQRRADMLLVVFLCCHN